MHPVDLAIQLEGRNRAWHAVKFAALTIMASAALALPAQASQGGTSVDSIRILNVTPDYVEMEASGLNDGSAGQLCLGVVATTPDISVHSAGLLQAILPVDKQYHVVVHVNRPNTLAATQTDLLLAMISPCGKSLLLRRKFKWPHTWPEKKADADAAPASSMEPFAWGVMAEEFDAIDRLLTKWSNPKERDANGDWKLAGFRAVYLNYSTANQEWKDMLQRIQRWRAYNPRSPGAAIAEAKYWAGYAWHIRGNGMPEETDPVAIKTFNERMQRAEQILKDSRDYASGSPLWYEAYLDIAISTQRDDRFIQQLFDEAIRKFPYYQPLYLDMARRWTPVATSHEDWNKVEEIISRAAANTADLDGSGNYAVLYLQLNALQKCSCELFKDSHVSWPKMRDSFEDLVKRYPSAENLNQYAALACRAGDKQAFLKVRPQIVDRILPSVWLDGYSYDTCDHKFLQKT